MTRICRNFCVAVAIAGVLMATIESRALAADLPDPQALVAKARELEDLRVDGKPPLRLQAELHAIGPNGALAQGAYRLIWLSGSRWREEISFGNYYLVRVGDTKGFWEKSPINYMPEIAFQLDRLLDVRKTLEIKPKQTLGKTKVHGKNAGRHSCTEVRSQSNTDRILCFDTTGLLATVEYPVGEHQETAELSRIEYGLFQIVGGKQIPYEVRGFQGTKMVTAVKVTVVDEIKDADPALFKVPAGADFWEHCEREQAAEPTVKAQPEYSESARRNREHGRVILYMVIEADGVPSHLTIIQHASPQLDNAVMHAVRQWRYKAQTCGGKPVRVQDNVVVAFTLNQ